jgi:hypothetical protein
MSDDNVKENKCSCSILHEVGVNTKDYQLTYCSDCETIKKFHWKSFWKRVKCVFCK